VERQLENFRARIAKISEVQKAKSAYFAGVVSKVTTIAAIEGEIKNVKEFGVQYKGLEETFAEAKKSGDSIISTKHEASGEISKMLTSAQEGNAHLLSASKETAEKLEKLLTQKKAIEELCIKISKDVQSLNLFIDNANGQIEEPIAVDSAKDAQKLIENFDALEKEYGQKKATLDTVGTLHKQVTDAHENPEVYSSISLKQITSKYDALKSGFGIKKTQLAKEKVTQEKNESLLNKVTEQFADFKKFVATHTEALEKEQTGELEDQLKKVREIATIVTPQSKEKVKKLNEVLTQIEQADIAEQSPVNSQEVAVLDAQMQKVLAKRIETIEAGILSKKQSNISEAQLKDFRDTFKFFDKEKSGHLTKIQFKAACAAVGEDIPDEKLESVFRSFDKDGDGKISFDEFISFVSSVAKEGAGKDDLLNAFKDLTKGEPVITENVIRSNFDKEQAEYFLKVMPKVTGGYDYVAYLDSAYAK